MNQVHDSKYTIGPISNIDFINLKDAFITNDISYEVKIDNEAMEKNENLNKMYKKNRQMHKFEYADPEISLELANRSYIYILINSADAEVAMPILTKMALTINELTPQPNGDALLETEDYLCPNCGFLSLSVGLCPQHGLRLLPYFEWQRHKKKLISDKNDKVARQVVLVGALLLAAWLTYILIDRLPRAS